MKENCAEGEAEKKDNTIEELNKIKEEKLVNLIANILVNKAIKKAHEKGYSLFEVQ